MTNKKYEFVPTDLKYLYRIKALRDFGDVKKGDLGGYVESEHNLSHYGDCWVYEDAKVTNNARVSGNAKVLGNAKVYGRAKVGDNTEVSDNARVSGEAKVSGNARVYGDATVSDFTEVGNNAKVYDNAKVFDFAWIYGNAQVYGNAKVFDSALVAESARVFGSAEVHTNVYGNIQVFDNAKRSGTKELREKNRKYELIKSDIEGLYRIMALRDFSDVKKGDIGGYVHHENNLSHEGDCWVYDDAKVINNARVSGFAKVLGDTIVSGDARVGDFTEVSGYNTLEREMQEYVISDKADRFNDDKVDLSFLPEVAVLEECKVWMNGAEKYGRDNWKKLWGEDTINVANASLLRHALAMNSGELYDPESGLPHAAHIRCNAAMILEHLARTKSEREDNEKKEKEKVEVFVGFVEVEYMVSQKYFGGAEIETPRRMVISELELPEFRKKYPSCRVITKYK